MEIEITAQRGGVIRKFHPNTWATMPEGKYGYQHVVSTEPPLAVLAAMRAAEVATPAAAHPQARAKGNKKGAPKPASNT